MTKEEVIKKVKNLYYKIKDMKEDITALWHITKCHSGEVLKIKEEIKRLHEELYKYNK